MEYQTRSRDMQWMGWLGGIALGALAMFVIDPTQGRRRRALLQDKVTHYSKETRRRVNSAMRDARNRLAGLQAEAVRLVSNRHAKPMDNHVLEARVRSRIARTFPEAKDLSITADRGVLMLGGEVDVAIEEPLIELVERIPGVESVSHSMRATAYDAGSRLSAMFSARSPWWVAGALGTGLLAWYGLTRQQPLSLIAAATGAGLLARRTPLSKPAGMREEATASAFEAERSVDIHALPDVVYDRCSHYENFPHFMSHVIEVRDLGNHRSHWVVQGIGGSEVEFESRLIDSDRPRRIAWRSEPGSVVDSEGVITLQPHAGGTRATVRMSWRDPSGNGLPVLLGTDADSALEDDLQRMKQFIEHGLPSRESTGGAAVLH